MINTWFALLWLIYFVYFVSCKQSCSVLNSNFHGCIDSHDFPIYSRTQFQAPANIYCQHLHHHNTIATGLNMRSPLLFVWLLWGRWEPRISMYCVVKVCSCRFLQEIDLCSDLSIVLFCVQGGTLISTCKILCVAARVAFVLTLSLNASPSGNCTTRYSGLIFTLISFSLSTFKPRYSSNLSFSSNVIFCGKLIHCTHKRLLFFLIKMRLYIRWSVSVVLWNSSKMECISFNLVKPLCRCLF